MASFVPVVGQRRTIEHCDGNGVTPVTSRRRAVNIYSKWVVGSLCEGKGCQQEQGRGFQHGCLIVLNGRIGVADEREEYPKEETFRLFKLSTTRIYLQW